MSKITPNMVRLENVPQFRDSLQNTIDILDRTMLSDMDDLSKAKCIADLLSGGA